MRIALVTDAWFPQVNGVVRTLSTVRSEIEAMGHEMAVINPAPFATIPCPKYPEIRLSLLPWPGVKDALDCLQPDAIHVATEGPLGVAGRMYCVRRKLPFTTSYHTQFPHYMWRYARVPVPVTYGVMRWFHNRAERTLVPTPSMHRELEAQGFHHPVTWTRGVDTETFQPYGKHGIYDTLPRPIFLYFGRVAREKNIEDFLQLDLPGSKVVIGGGPALPALRSRYTDTHFIGYRFGEALGRHIAAADVFVFPSRTDTFGVVLLEAMACGVPVAAYPVTGPIDIVKPGEVGALSDDLRTAALDALACDPQRCREHALTFTWRRCAEMFVDNLAVFGGANGEVKAEATANRA